MNHITVNVVKPEENAIVPNTGVFTASSYSSNGTTVPYIGVLAIILLIITSVIITAVVYRFKAKRGEESANRFLKISATFILLLTFISVFSYLKLNDNHFSAQAEDESADVLSITVDDVTINVELEDEPVYAMGTSTVTINSATEAGYTLSAYVENADLVSEETTQIIASLADSESTTKLDDNTWGVALTSPTDQNSEVFFGLPTDANGPRILKETTEATTTGDTTTLYYATYVTPELEYGTYTGAVINYIAVANPAPLYLQNVDEWGSDLAVGDEIEAVDKRDGKTYLVSRLQDGNIWMMQNLDLDLNANTEYTNEDTDLGYNAITGEYETASWQPTSSTTINADGWTFSNFAPASYDPGDWYWNGRSNWEDWEDYYATCERNERTGEVIRDSGTGKMHCDDTADPFSSFVESTGIPQYHLGNFYNWSAAVATNDSSIYSDSDIASSSICPTEWRLPSADDFFDLWAEYGFVEEAINGDDKLWTEPLYFVISGGYATIMDYVGTESGFWSSEAKGEDKARGVGFADDGWMFQGQGRRNYGRSIRCVAR